VNYFFLIDSLLGAMSSLIAIAEFLRRRRGREGGGAASGDQSELPDHRDGDPGGDQGI
jgi:hypothetical protein